MSSDMILTAAHCLDWFDTILHHGATPQEYNGDLPFTHVQVHPDFDSESYKADIMVIKLKNPIHGASIIEMNDGQYGPFHTHPLLVVGFGATEGDSRGRASGGSLHFAEVPYVPNGRCEGIEVDGQQMYQNQIFPSMLCAGGLGRDACQGDSGSPLVEPLYEKDVLVGIVSWGRGCAQYPGVYTRISYFYNWVREKICWDSVDPPDYLDCQAKERSPEALAASSENEFESSPSVSPSIHGGVWDGHEKNGTTGRDWGDWDKFKDMTSSGISWFARKILTFSSASIVMCCFLS